MKNKLFALIIFLATITGCSNQTISLEEIQEQTITELPEKIILDVPFISQAPHANWDDPYQEACEEASMIMVYNYLEGVSSITPDEADKQILNLVAYQDSIGLPYDINTSEMKQVINDFYKKESTVVTEKSINIESFKNLLANGTPIIIPAQGQQLNNPNFSNGGPEYHMLVIIGYNESKKIFITNDPGTRKGKHYEYSYDTIMKAIHDWTGDKKTVINGPKKALIFNN